MFTHNQDLSHLTTFGIPAKAKLFAEYTSEKELLKISRSDEFINNEVIHIGGGSNLLFVDDFNGLVLHSGIKGIKRYEKDADNVFAIAGAGVKWTDFVDWCVEQGLAGVENLAGIPGEVGAAPVQNVGAYGAEAKDVVHHVRCFDTLTREFRTVTNEECEFGYRDSRFKHDWKGRYIVVQVSFRLTPSDVATNLEYGPLKNLKEELGYNPTIKEVAKRVVEIRNTKLPDPAVIGSAGSFFKNPVVNRYLYEQDILGINPDVPCYHLPDDEHHVKVPAGWLIEHSGLKYARVGGAYVYPGNCLVIANDGTASAADVVELSERITRVVRQKMGINLHPEVNFIDTSMEITIMGSGTSKGVPEVACACRTCRSPYKKDKRLRASALVKTHGMQFLIDVSPDFRRQALDNGIFDLDAALITHSHYDHVGGIDDLRPFCSTHNFPLYLKEDVLGDLKRRVDYCFRDKPYPGVPVFDPVIVDNEPFYMNGLKVTPIHVMHGKLPILGYRIGDFAYITDAKTVPEEELEKLHGLKVLVVNALRKREHFAHFSFREAVDFIRKVNPEEAYLTHFNHEVGYHHELETAFGPHIHPCYDGLKIHIP